jgi:chemotaxis protein MotB
MSSGGAPRRKRREEHEEHENHERWLVTYADMVTLLMVLFIVMFAMSVVDERKFNALKEGLAAGFGDSTAILEGSSNILDHPGTSAVDMIEANSVTRGMSPEEKKKFAEALQEESALQQQRKYAEAAAEVNRLQELLDKIDAALRAKGLRDDVHAGIDERGLVISLVSRHVTFEPNLADLSDRGAAVLDTIAPVLTEAGNPLEINGHTNQVPVKPKYYPTDWELSAARAVTVLRYLNESCGLPNDMMTASAFGHEQPLMDPSKPGSQAVNKRVDIVIQPELAPETQALLDDVVADQQREGEDGATDSGADSEIDGGVDSEGHADAGTETGTETGTDSHTDSTTDSTETDASHGSDTDHSTEALQ